MIGLDVRIDTVTWEAPLHGHQSAPRPRVRQINVRTGELTGTTDFLNGLDLPGGVRVQMKTRGDERFLRFSGSLPRVLNGHNVFPATVDDCVQAMEIVEGSMPIEGLSPFSSRRRVRRVDVVRDFWPVPNGPDLISSIACDPTYRRTHSEHYRTDRGQSSGTLYRGPQRAQSVLYDKPSAVASRNRHLEPDARRELVELASGRLRYELRYTQQQLRRHVGTTLMDIENDHLLSEAHRRFTEAHFDRAGLGVNDFVRQIAEGDLTASRKNSLLGAAIFESLGLDVGLSQNTVDRNRRDMRDLGVVLDQLGSTGEPARLDFLAGEAITGLLPT